MEKQINNKNKKRLFKNLTKEQKIKQIKVGTTILAVLIIIFAFIAYQDYQERPGVLSPDEIVATERTTDSITLEWDNNRNTDIYYVFYKQKGKAYKKWTKLSLEHDENTENNVIKLDGLKEGTSYRVVVRADNDERKGFITEGKYYTTKSTQQIESRDSYSFVSTEKGFYIKATANTLIEYSSSDKNVAVVNRTSGKVKITGVGTAVITAKAKENAYYTEASKNISVIVMDAYNVKPSEADVKIIYDLNKNNCTIVKVVSGADGVRVPQGLAYTGNKYIISYGMHSSQRIISFDVNGDGKSVSNPKINLGHPNGFTYCSNTGLCYCVKGWSTRAVTYNPKTDEYGEIHLKYGCSGIAYDRAQKCFYTSSRTAMRMYSGDGKFESLKGIGVVKHSGKVYTQDCGGHAGIMMHCLSGSNKDGTNYIDLYDMINGKYLGTLRCELEEVESAIVDKDGYLELLSNHSNKKDYIYRTPINIEDIAE